MINRNSHVLLINRNRCLNQMTDFFCRFDFFDIQSRGLNWELPRIPSNFCHGTGKHKRATSKLQQMQGLAAGSSNPAFLQMISQENSLLHHNAKEKLSKVKCHSCCLVGLHVIVRPAFRAGNPALRNKCIDVLVMSKEIFLTFAVFPFEGLRT